MNAGVEHLGARSLSFGMSQPSEPTYDDAGSEMMGMISDQAGGCFKDEHVDDLEPEVHAQQPGTYTLSGMHPS